MKHVKRLLIGFFVVSIFLGFGFALMHGVSWALGIMPRKVLIGGLIFGIVLGLGTVIYGLGALTIDIYEIQ